MTQKKIEPTMVMTTKTTSQGAFSKANITTKTKIMKAMICMLCGLSEMDWIRGVVQKVTFSGNTDNVNFGCL